MSFQYILRLASDGGKAVLAMFDSVGDKGEKELKRIEKSVDLTNHKFDTFEKFVKRGALAVTAAASALAYMSQRSAETIDANSKMASSFDVTYAALVNNGTVFQEAGFEIEKMGKAWNDLSLKLGSGQANEAMALLNLNVKDLMGMSPDKQFDAVAAAISRLDNENLKAAVSSELFGNEQGRKLLPLMDDYSAKVADAAAFNEKFGISLSDIDVAQVAQANDAFGRVKSALGGIINTMTVQLAPAFEAVANWLVSLGYDKDLFAQGVARSMDALAAMGDVVRRAYHGASIAISGVKVAAWEAEVFVTKALNKIGSGIAAVMNVIPGVEVKASFNEADIAQAQAGLDAAYRDLDRKLKDNSKAFEPQNTILGKLQIARNDSLERARLSAGAKAGDSFSAGIDDAITKMESLDGKTQKLKKSLKESDDIAEDFISGLVNGFEDGELSVEEFRRVALRAIDDLLKLKTTGESTLGAGIFGGFLSGAGSFFKSFLPSYDKGIDRVPYDQVAQIHQDETVLNPHDAAIWRRGGSGGGDMDVIVNNYSSARVSTRQQRSSDGGRSVIIQLDEGVSELLADPSSRTSRAAARSGGLTGR